MNLLTPAPSLSWQAHTWLRRIRIAAAPGPHDPLAEKTTAALLETFRQNGHTLLDAPQGEMDVILTTARFGEPLGWREALMFVARRRYNLSHTPTIYTVISATPAQFREKIAYFESVLAKEPPDPADYTFPGMAPMAYRTLVEQGRRGGPILALVRLMQSQSKSIRIILVVGEDEPQEAYTFDLVGAFPRTPVEAPQSFYDDLMYRILTAVSTHEVTAHKVVGEPVTQAAWQRLGAPPAMRTAGLELGRRGFFTEMVVIDNLVTVPAVAESVSSQYSEGCFATWEPQIDALIATITGSARPVDKEHLTDDELAVIAGLRPDGLGAQVRVVEGKRNDPPSSEAVEMVKMDEALPRLKLDWVDGTLPAARSKLHGHRGVASYDPRLVEHVYLDAPFYHYPVSCSTEAQAHAITAAFSRSQALADPDDPRRLVFTVLPGHGIVIAEKWLQGKVPFQVIWEAMDSGALVVENHVPQGPLAFVPQGEQRMVLKELSPAS